MARLKKTYAERVVPALIKKNSYKNTMQVPKLDKIVISISSGEFPGNAKALDSASNDLATISGQKPYVARAKKSIAGFKLREEQPLGVAVTLRKDRMWEFFDRFVSVALPRTRYFRGLNPNSFDGRGNFTVGIKEQIMFPEINYDKVDKIRGMNITFVTTGNTNEEARDLLGELGMPFRK
jgi:large subunit ribosomal protein L5